MSHNPPSSENPDKRSLPPGWTAQYDENYKTWFYVNTRAVPPQSSWKHRDDLVSPSYAPPSGPPPPSHSPGYSAPSPQSQQGERDWTGHPNTQQYNTPLGGYGGQMYAPQGGYGGQYGPQAGSGSPPGQYPVPFGQYGPSAGQHSPSPGQYAPPLGQYSLVLYLCASPNKHVQEAHLRPHLTCIMTPCSASARISC